MKEKENIYSLKMDQIKESKWGKGVCVAKRQIAKKNLGIANKQLKNFLILK